MAETQSFSTSSCASTVSASASTSDTPASPTSSASAFSLFWPSAAPSPPPMTRTKLATGDGEGVVAFPSRGAGEFRYRLSRAPRDALRLWLEDKCSKQQWQSEELALSAIVTEENAIPTMQLQDYFEAFKSSLLAADTGLCRGANKLDLVALKRGVDKSTSTEKSDASATQDTAAAIADDDKDDDDDERLELQLTLAVQVFSKVLTPTYRFELRRVALSDLDVVHARIRDQSEEIDELRAEVAELAVQLATPPPRPLQPPPSLFGSSPAPLASLSDSSPSLFSTSPSLFSTSPSLFGSSPSPFGPSTVLTTPVFLRATTTQPTQRDHPLAWSCNFGAVNTSWFQLLPEGGGVRVLRAGVFSVHVVVQHANTFNPDNVGLFGNPPPGREAFYLAKNREKIALSFGSTTTGAMLSSPLAHLLPLVPSDELSVVYCGSGVAMSGSSFAIALIR